MSAAVRIQRQRARGWRMPANTVYVGRPSYYGNPFLGEPAAAVAAYRQFLAGGELRLEIGPDNPITGLAYIPAWNAPAEIVRAARANLCGKNLACWCPLGAPCHADVLLEIANGGAA